MKLLLRHTHYNEMIVGLYISAIFIGVLPFLGFQESYQKNPLGFYFILLFCFLVLGMLVNFLPRLTSSLKVSDGDIEVKKWGLFSTKLLLIQASEIKNLEVTYGTVQKTLLILNLKNNSKLVMNINYINKIEGQLPEIELSQYAPSDPTLKLTLQVAVLLSKDFKVPFETIYLR